MRFPRFANAGLIALMLSTGAASASALPPLEENARIMGELVSGEVSYQIQKHCPTISARYLRAYGKLRKLEKYALSLGYTDDDFDAVSNDPGAKAKRDALVEAYFAAHGVTKGDSDSYCRLGQEEIQKNSLTGWLLRAN